MKTKLTPLFVSLLLVALVVTACGPQVVRDAEAKATEIANNAQATAIVGTAMIEAGMSQNEPTALPSPIPQFTPTAPVVIPATPTLAPAQPTPMQECKAINDYQLKDLTELSSQPNSLIHVEWYAADGQPEYESVLPSGRYTVDKPFPGGHVWEYSTSCSVEQVLNQVAGHIARRLQNQANNKGYRPWEDLVDLGFISQVTSTSSVVVPDVLP